MKISELIAQLNKLKREHGDVEVRAGDPEWGDGMHRVYSVEPSEGRASVHLNHHYGGYCRECHRGCD